MNLLKIAFILGCQRCGSTLLAKLMGAHPSIRINRPLRPEPKFFLKEDYAELGLEYYLSTFFDLRVVPAPDTYLLEKSTSYVEYPIVTERIKSFFPFPRFFIILRHPVYRAISNYKFSVENGLETRTPEQVFIEEVPAPNTSLKSSVSPFDYLKRSDYPRQLAPFRAENIHYVIFEKLLSDPSRELTKVFAYLGLKPENTFPSAELPKVNASKFTDSISEKVLNKLKARFAEVVDHTAEITGEDLTIWKEML